MAGVDITLMNGMRAEAELAALYDVRQLILKYMRTFSSKGRNAVSTNNKVKEHLAKIRLVALNQHMQTNKRNQKRDKPIMIPKVGKDTVMVNRVMAAFGDVIALYQLLQAKQQQGNTKKNHINLHEEMEKCCLLRNTKNDTRLLQGFVEVWRGGLHTEKNALKDITGNDSQPTTNLKLHRSKAFPENLLYLVPEIDDVEYAAIVRNEIIFGDKKRTLPLLDGIVIPFILSTNLDNFTLRLSAGGDHANTISIPEGHLDDDVTIMRLRLIR